MRQQAIEVEDPIPSLAPSGMRRASWGAIFAGIFVTIIIQIILTVLGIAIGVTSIHPPQPQGMRVLATASGIWLLVTALISTWLGSWVAGRLSGGPLRADGMVHGIVRWSVATVTAFYLMASAVSAALGAFGSVLDGAIGPLTYLWGEQGQAGLAQTTHQEPAQALTPTGRTQSGPGKLAELAAQDPQLTSSIARVESKGGAAQDQADKDAIIDRLKTQYKMSQEDAVQAVNQRDQDFQKSRGQAKQVAQEAAPEMVRGAWWAFIVLVLGLLFAAWGGWAGAASLPVFVASTTRTTVTAPI